MAVTVMTLKIPAVTKVAMGHQQHTTGSGVHRDKRLKRSWNRQQQKTILKREHS